MGDRILQGKHFYQLFDAGKFDEAEQILKDDPNIVFVMGWLSMSCYGGWGMHQFKHFGAKLQKERGEEYTKGPRVRQFAKAVCKAFSPDNVHEELGLLLNYALVADWHDIAKEIIDSGFDFKEKEQMANADIAMSKEMKLVWDNWTETKKVDTPECSICMDAPCDAIFHPCTHSDFCFACSRDLKDCPICRTEGYAKPRK